MLVVLVVVHSGGLWSSNMWISVILGFSPQHFGMMGQTELFVYAGVLLRMYIVFVVVNFTISILKGKVQCNVLLVYILLQWK